MRIFSFLIAVVHLASSSLSSSPFSVSFSFISLLSRLARHQAHHLHQQAYKRDRRQSEKSYCVLMRFAQLASRDWRASLCIGEDSHKRAINWWCRWLRRRWRWSHPCAFAPAQMNTWTRFTFLRRDAPTSSSSSSSSSFLAFSRSALGQDIRCERQKMNCALAQRMALARFS